MAGYMLIVHSDCRDPAREDEFNAWYNDIHIPDMLKIPGMVQATRWENAYPPGNDRRRYIAVYEAETDDLEAFLDQLRKHGQRSVEGGRYSDLMVREPPDVPRVIYRQLMPVKRAAAESRSVRSEELRTER